MNSFVINRSMLSIVTKFISCLKVKINTFFEFKTTKGKLCIGYLGEKYRFKYESKITGYKSWICCENESSGCLATIKTYENTITKQPITHFGHKIGNENCIRAAIISSNIKESASNSGSAPSTIVNTETRGLALEILSLMPTDSALKRTINRNRKKNSIYTTDPELLIDLRIPQDLKFTASGHRFLLWDSHDDEQEEETRIIIFATDNSLQELSESLDWFADDLKPRTIMTDFEKGAMNAGRSVFTQSNIKACLFHLTQNIWKHIQLLGLSSLYKAPVSNEESTQQFNDDCKKHMKYLFAIAFVPVNDVVNTNYIGEVVPQEGAGRRRRKKDRKEPLFAINVWNMYDNVLSDSSRTINCLEAWHRVFNKRVAISHPQTPVFIQHLVEVQDKVERDLNHIDNGVPNTQRKNQRIRDQRIKRIVEKYNDSDHIQYLNSIGNYFDFIHN
ncbi:hypothetical protein BpHYR1_032451 [Brachionus plicatilis]|uniref:MULE transposase domain-containing protein n=1 Tax=Brachionus plicatilis TaxID=10195 RepID=A0A3M7SU17_BRAPC|nr:hypothetical protein BpHYR1_032451 [Brachionus plicatilis]